MKLREFLTSCKRMLEEFPEALDMEMFATHGASGETNPISSPHVEEVDEDIRDMLYRGYDKDLYVEVYIGN